MKRKLSDEFKSDLKKWRKNESRVRDILTEAQEERRETSNELDGFPTDAKVESDQTDNKKKENRK